MRGLPRVSRASCIIHPIAAVTRRFKGERISLPIVKEVTTVASIAMPVGERWNVRRCRYAPEAGGAGRLCLATGMHGDETLGQLIVFGVVSRILREPERLRGIVDVYPMLNPLGLDIGERMVPSVTRLDMNRAFPGSSDGTALEGICHSIFTDMLGADLVLDIHTSTQFKSELYEARVSARQADVLLAEARDLCPELLWVLPERSDFDASLTGALVAAGTKALILEADERRRRPQEIADIVVGGIFCKMRQMGLWDGDVERQPAHDIPCILGPQDVVRVACEQPGMYVPNDRIGTWVEEGELLGVVIDALQGAILEQVFAPAAGLVFSQRSYSSVYPGTLIARLCRKERP